MLVAQSCPPFCDPMDCSQPGSSVHEIFQARILEYPVFPSPGDLPNPGIELGSPALQADPLPSEPPGKPYLYRFTYSGVPYKLKHTIFILLHLLLSLSIMFSRFIHITACHHFTPFTDWILFHCVNILHFVDPFISWWILGLFLPLPFVNNTYWYRYTNFSLRSCFQFFWVYASRFMSLIHQLAFIPFAVA